MRIIKIAGMILLIVILFIIAFIVIALLFLKFYPSVGRLPDDAQKQVFKKENTLYYDDSFHNEKEGSLISGEGYPASERRVPEQTLKAETPGLLTDAKDDDLTFTWLGHSSFLIQLGNKNLLFDPVLGGRTSPVSFAGPKRFSEIPITAAQMPEIDVLLLSHDHYDHLDYDTIKEIRSKVKKFIVPLGVDTILKGWGVEADKIIVLNWWETVEIDGTIYTLTPSQHFTGRNPLKRNSTLWGGYYINNEYHRIYYTGDGGYSDAFKNVNERLGTPDLMLAECGQYDPSWSGVHMFPEETVQAAVDADASWMIPVHWGAFCICNHAWDDPIIRVTAEAENRNLSIATPRIGQTVDYDRIEIYNEKWWEAYR